MADDPLYLEREDARGGDAQCASFRRLEIPDIDPLPFALPCDPLPEPLPEPFFPVFAPAEPAPPPVTIPAFIIRNREVVVECPPEKVSGPKPPPEFPDSYTVADGTLQVSFDLVGIPEFTEAQRRYVLTSLQDQERVDALYAFFSLTLRTDTERGILLHFITTTTHWSAALAAIVLDEALARQEEVDASAEELGRSFIVCGFYNERIIACCSDNPNDPGYTTEPDVIPGLQCVTVDSGTHFSQDSLAEANARALKEAVSGLTCVYCNDELVKDCEDLNPIFDPTTPIRMNAEDYTPLGDLDGESFLVVGFTQKITLKWRVTIPPDVVCASSKAAANAMAEALALSELNCFFVSDWRDPKCTDADVSEPAHARAQAVGDEAALTELLSDSAQWNNPIFQSDSETGEQIQELATWRAVTVESPTGAFISATSHSQANLSADLYARSFLECLWTSPEVNCVCLDVEVINGEAYYRYSEDALAILLAELGNKAEYRPERSTNKNRVQQGLLVSAEFPGSLIDQAMPWDTDLLKEMCQNGLQCIFCNPRVPAECPVVYKQLEDGTLDIKTLDAENLPLTIPPEYADYNVSPSTTIGMEADTICGDDYTLVSTQVDGLSSMPPSSSEEICVYGNPEVEIDCEDILIAEGREGEIGDLNEASREAKVTVPANAFTSGGSSPVEAIENARAAAFAFAKTMLVCAFDNDRKQGECPPGASGVLSVQGEAQAGLFTSLVSKEDANLQAEIYARTLTTCACCSMALSFTCPEDANKELSASGEESACDALGLSAEKPPGVDVFLPECMFLTSVPPLDPTTAGSEIGTPDNPTDDCSQAATCQAEQYLKSLQVCYFCSDRFSGDELCLDPSTPVGDPLIFEDCFIVSTVSKQDANDKAQAAAKALQLCESGNRVIEGNGCEAREKIEDCQVTAGGASSGPSDGDDTALLTVEFAPATENIIKPSGGEQIDAGTIKITVTAGTDGQPAENTATAIAKAKFDVDLVCVWGNQQVTVTCPPPIIDEPGASVTVCENTMVSSTSPGDANTQALIAAVAALSCEVWNDENGDATRGGGGGGSDECCPPEDPPQECLPPDALLAPVTVEFKEPSPAIITGTEDTCKVEAGAVKLSAPAGKPPTLSYTGGSGLIYSAPVGLAYGSAKKAANAIAKAQHEASKICEWGNQEVTVTCDPKTNIPGNAAGSATICENATVSTSSREAANKQAEIMAKALLVCAYQNGDSDGGGGSTTYTCPDCSEKDDLASVEIPHGYCISLVSKEDAERQAEIIANSMLICTVCNAEVVVTCSEKPDPRRFDFGTCTSADPELHPNYEWGELEPSGAYEAVMHTITVPRCMFAEVVGMNQLRVFRKQLADDLFVLVDRCEETKERANEQARKFGEAQLTCLYPNQPIQVRCAGEGDDKWVVACEGLFLSSTRDDANHQARIYAMTLLDCRLDPNLILPRHYWRIIGDPLHPGQCLISGGRIRYGGGAMGEEERTADVSGYAGDAGCFHLHVEISYAGRTVSGSIKPGSPPTGNDYGNRYFDLGCWNPNQIPAVTQNLHNEVTFFDMYPLGDPANDASGNLQYFNNDLKAWVTLPSPNVEANDTWVLTHDTNKPEWRDVTPGAGSGGSAAHPWKVTRGADTEAGVATWNIAIDPVYSQGGPKNCDTSTVTGNSLSIWLKIDRDPTSREMAGDPTIVTGANFESTADYQYRLIAKVDAGGDPEIIQYQFEEIRIHELMIVSNGEFDLGGWEMSHRNTYPPPA